MFVERGLDGVIQFTLVKMTDELLFAGKPQTTARVVELIKDRLDVRKAITQSKMHFGGCQILQHVDGRVAMDMDEYMESSKEIDLDRARRKHEGDAATKGEYDRYRFLAGEMISAGYGTSPQTALIGSYTQQHVPRLRVRQLTEDNPFLKYLKDMPSIVRFKVTRRDTDNLEIVTHSDASLNIVTGR